MYVSQTMGVMACSDWCPNTLRQLLYDIASYLTTNSWRPGWSPKPNSKRGWLRSLTSCLGAGARLEESPPGGRRCNPVGDQGQWRRRWGSPCSVGYPAFPHSTLPEQQGETGRGNKQKSLPPTSREWNNGWLFFLKQKRSLVACGHLAGEGLVDLKHINIIHCQTCRGRKIGDLNHRCFLICNFTSTQIQIDLTLKVTLMLYKNNNN